MRKKLKGVLLLEAVLALLLIGMASYGFAEISALQYSMAGASKVADNASHYADLVAEFVRQEGYDNFASSVNTGDTKKLLNDKFNVGGSDWYYTIKQVGSEINTSSMGTIKTVQVAVYKKSNGTIEDTPRYTTELPLSSRDDFKDWVTTNINDLWAKIAYLETGLNNLDAKLNQKVAELNSSIHNLETSINNKIASIQTELNTLKAGVNNLKDRVASLEATSAWQTSNIYSLSQRVNDLETAYNNLKSRVDSVAANTGVTNLTLAGHSASSDYPRIISTITATMPNNNSPVIGGIYVIQNNNNINITTLRDGDGRGSIMTNDTVSMASTTTLDIPNIGTYTINTTSIKESITTDDQGIRFVVNGAHIKLPIVIMYAGNGRFLTLSTSGIEGLHYSY